jgi:hypothetical protein
VEVTELEEDVVLGTFEISINDRKDIEVRKKNSEENNFLNFSNLFRDFINLLFFFRPRNSGWN